MKIALSSYIVFLVVLVSLSAQALEPLVLYDDFNTRLIDADKWFGGEDGDGGTEAIRRIQQSHLRLIHRAYGHTDSDTGFRFRNFSLYFRNPGAVTEIQATVQVQRLETKGCATLGSEPTGVRVGLHGHFFNTGIPTPGSNLGDVFAVLRLVRSSSFGIPLNVLRIEAGVGECTTDVCQPERNFEFVDLGPVKVRERVTLRMQWDPDNDRFIFQRDNEPEVAISYPVSDTSPPGVLFRVFEIAHNVANCTVTPRPVSFMDAFFDDVHVNESAVP